MPPISWPTALNESQMFEDSFYMQTVSEQSASILPFLNCLLPTRSTIVDRNENSLSDLQMSLNYILCVPITSTINIFTLILIRKLLRL